MTGKIQTVDDILRSKYLRDSIESYQKYLSENFEEEESPDKILKMLIDLVDLIVECEQYSQNFYDDLTEVKKICLIKVRMSKVEVESLFKVKPLSIYGTAGLFVPLRGLFIGPELRKQTAYDESLEAKGKQSFNVDIFAEELQEVYDFRLTTPAYRGLFIPRRTGLTSLINSAKNIEFFDSTINF